MSTCQAFHGGRLLEAEREFGLTRDQFVDFSSNLNVFAPAVPALEWASWSSHATRYPQADAETVRLRLADYYGVDAEFLLPTSGASEALYLVARLFRDRKVAVVEPGFSDYSRSFRAAGCECSPVILPQTWWYEPVQKWVRSLEPFDVVVLGNPNNPTGSLQRKEELLHLFEQNRGRCRSWVIDEAFLEFIECAERETLLSTIREFSSLIVIRSLTKSWRIPGLRLGFVATSGPINQLRRMQPPWSVNSLAEAWASSFLTAQRRAELALSFEEMRTEKRQFATQLGRISGIRVHPGAANFLLVELIDGSLEAADLYRELGRRGILVRVCDSFQGMTEGRFVRLAVRTASENDRLIRELAALCEQKTRRVA